MEFECPRVSRDNQIWHDLYERFAFHSLDDRNVSSVSETEPESRNTVFLVFLKLEGTFTYGMCF